jgi:hypothetical protein
MEIKPQLLKKLNERHGREIEIISTKYLNLKGYAVKFRFVDDGYEKSELVKL